ncbi:MAG: hypothetical protein GX750_03875 [Clostridia bacterium]|nr:hypothetical protein [Clostridia bacterium]
MAGFSLSRTLYIIGFCLAIIFAFTSAQPAGQAQPFELIEAELSWLSLKEDEVFQELFSLSMTLDSLEREAETLARETVQIAGDLGQLDHNIRLQEQRHQRTVEGLEQVLKTYQKTGPASYLEILLEARDLKDFIRRVSFLQELAKNTRQLLQSIEEIKTELAGERERYHEKLAELTAKQEQVENARRKAVQVRKQMEEYLSALAQEREYYQEQLQGMQQTWGQLQPFFAKTLQELAEIIEWDRIPLDAMKTRVSLRGIHGSLAEDTFNEIIEEYPELAGVVFRFSPGQASLVLPESRLVLDGVFVIVDQTAIMFQVTKGTFYGFPLDKDSMNQLLQNNELVIDFKPLVGNNLLRSIEIREKEVELLITPFFLQNRS